MSFVSPAFLWGLLGISLPLVIHLLQLRRPRRLQFTNTSFIREIESRKGQRRIQDWLILALRMLTIVSLVLAFSQPFIPARIGQVGGKIPQIQVFVDNSRSMQAPADNQSSLATEAIEIAKSLGNSYGADAQLQLLGHLEQGVTQNSFRTAIATHLQRSRATGWGAPVVRQAWESPGNGMLYIVSDFQKNELQSKAFAHFSTRREIRLLPQVSKPVGNVYVDSIWLDDAFVRTKADLGLHIKLRNGGSESIVACPIKVLLEGKQIAALQVTVAAGQAKEEVVQVQLPNAQQVIGKVVTGDTPVTFDNTYYFTLQPADAVQVMEIGPAPITQAAYQREPLFRYQYTRTQQVDFGKLQRANLVLVTEPTVLEAGLQAALASVVRRGGSVVVVPSALPQAHEGYNQLLRALGVGGVQWEKPDLVARQELAMPNLRSPFFRDVFGVQPRQIALPEVSPVMRLANGGTDILRLRDGTSFLTDFELGSGHAYIFSAPFDKKYSDFTSQALFIPVLYRLAILSYRNDQPLAYRIGQRAVTLRVPASEKTAANEAAYRLVRDSVTLVPTQRLLGQQLQLQLPAELTKPGVYQLSRHGQVVTELAFNESKKESELAAYSVAELRQLVGPNRPNVQVLDASAQPAALQNYRAQETSQPLWRYCLMLTLACLLVEGAVLRWGRRTQALRTASS